MQQSMTHLYLFDFITRVVDSTNVALKHLPLKGTSKKLSEEDAIYNCFDRFWIQDFGNAWLQSYGKIQWHDPLIRAQ